MTTTTVEVFIAAFNGEHGAAASLKDFESAERAGAIDLIDAAVIVHTADGKVKYEETADPSGKKWAKRGAIAGGLVGLIFPPSIIAGAVVGGAGGGIWGKIRDKGFKDEELKELGESLRPAHRPSSPSPRTMSSSSSSAASRATDVARHAVSADAAAALVAEVDDARESNPGS